jgi:hypothetical protein
MEGIFGDHRLVEGTTLGYYIQFLSYGPDANVFYINSNTSGGPGLLVDNSAGYVATGIQSATGSYPMGAGSIGWWDPNVVGSIASGWEFLYCVIRGNMNVTTALPLLSCGYSLNSTDAVSFAVCSPADDLRGARIGYDWASSPCTQSAIEVNYDLGIPLMPPSLPTTSTSGERLWSTCAVPSGCKYAGS